MTMNFSLQKYHDYSLSDLEFMMPWERKIVVTQVQKWLEEEKRKLERKKNARK